jgi:hypothetical protein
VEILFILFSQSFFVPRLVPGGAIKQVIVRGDGLGLGKLKIDIVISTYIEHVGGVSKVVYE